MLLLPVGHDAPGNTARAVYHGFALRADFQKVSVSELKLALEKLLDDPSYSGAAKRMSRRFVDLQDQTPSLPIIESVLGGRLPLQHCV
jgi:zeaxanthin glucosyltransferase